MKILVIGPSPIRSKGGMATVIEEIAKDKKLNEEFEIDIYESYIDGNKLKVLLFSVLSFLRFYFTKRNYDVYHIHAASYGSTFRKGWYIRAVKKWKKKAILHIHGAEYMVFYEKSNKKEKIRSILNAADIVIALSDEWKHRFDENFGLTNCVVLENGIDMERLAPAISNYQEHPHSFVSLGRIGKRKGTYDLIATIDQVKSEVPDIKCYLAGDGEIEKCKELIKMKKLEDSIIVIGWADFDKKVELLQKSSVLILPSYNEGLPMAILEGMACGKAIISTTVGAIPEVVKKENGILIKPGDIIALADALRKYCRDEKTVEMAGSANRNLIKKNYSMDVMHQKLAQYYISVMQGG